MGSNDRHKIVKLHFISCLRKITNVALQVRIYIGAVICLPIDIYSANLNYDFIMARFFLCINTNFNPVFLFFLIFDFLHLHGADFQRQPEQVDESVRVVMVVEFSGGEAGQ